MHIKLTAIIALNNSSLGSYSTTVKTSS